MKKEYAIKIVQLRLQQVCLGCQIMNDDTKKPAQKRFL